MVLFIAAPFMFGAAGAYATFVRNKTDERICKVVLGLRRDLVEVVTDSKNRSLKNAKQFPHPLRELIIRNSKESFKSTLSKIGDQQCP